MKKISKSLILLSLLAGSAVSLASCGDNNNTSQSSQTTYDGDYAVRLTAIGSTTINVSKTVQLRSSVTGTTSKDVIFSSSDPSVASVTDKGLVTGLSVGKAVIKCALKIEPRCYAEITINVEASVAPTSLTIQGTDKSIQWVGESVQLSVLVTPIEASSLVDWSTNNPDVATVTDYGLVEFLAVGDVTITATSKDDVTVFNSITFDVKEGMFRSDLGSPLWDLSHQGDEEPYVALDIDASNLGYHSCYFANVKSTRYYVEGEFTIEQIISTWAWQGIGFGSGLSETSTRYFIFSPRVEGQGNDHNKVIVKDMPNESWPAITTRSQNWGGNGLDNVDWQHSPVKVGLLRDGNMYYYTVNDRLMYVDETTMYDGIPTMPIMVAIDLPVTVRNYRYSVDDTEIDSLLNSATYKKSFYVSDEDRVDYKSDNDITFKSNTIQCKDNYVKSLGDMAKLVGNFEVEFDYEDMLPNNGHTAGMSGLALNLTRYDSPDTIESFMVGKSSELPELAGLGARYMSWNYTIPMDNPTSPYYWLETSTPVYENPNVTHHVKVTRTIENNIATFKMFVDDNEVTFDILSSKWESMTSKYTGAYVLWMAGEYASAHITKLTYKSGL